MERVAVIGAGLIGRAWAIVFARAGHEVALFDADAESLQRNLEALDASLADLARSGLVRETPAAIRARIRVASDLEDAIAGANYVQENVAETLAA
jgi:3-hydroxyacyl-CoA dehydrogenase